MYKSNLAVSFGGIWPICIQSVLWEVKSLSVEREGERERSNEEKKRSREMQCNYKLLHSTFYEIYPTKTVIFLM